MNERMALPFWSLVCIPKSKNSLTRFPERTKVSGTCRCASLAPQYNSSALSRLPAMVDVYGYLEVCVVSGRCFSASAQGLGRLGHQGYAVQVATALSLCL